MTETYFRKIEMIRKLKQAEQFAINAHESINPRQNIAVNRVNFRDISCIVDQGELKQMPVEHNLDKQVGKMISLELNRDGMIQDCSLKVGDGKETSLVRSGQEIKTPEMQASLQRQMERQISRSLDDDLSL